MPQPTPQTMDQRERALYSYMVGWRIGSRSGALAPMMADDPHVKAGYDEGQRAMRGAYGAACKRYGAVLSLLHKAEAV